jgi:hypothetical protein
MGKAQEGANGERAGHQGGDAGSAAADPKLEAQSKAQLGTIYTASTPGYDRRPLRQHSEQGVELDVRVPPAGVDPVLWNREHKLIHPPKAGLWSMYLDGSLSPKGPVRESVEAWLANADMALFKHPWRTCAYDEIDECVKRGKLTATQGDKARSHLMLAGFPRHFGLWACGMVARRVHCNSLQIFMAPFWWDMTKDCPRDQIWLPFVLWRIGSSLKRLHTIDKDIYNNKLLSFVRHHR